MKTETMRILVLAVFAMVFGWVFTDIAHATAAANLDQCANGAFGVPPPFCSAGSGGNDWQNGNLNKTNSNYRLGDSVPFRDVMSGISGAGNTIQIEFQATNSNSHAYDYMTTWNRSVPGADPCKGVAGCVLGSPSSTVLIPVDPSVTGCNIPLGNQVPGNFVMWNATITGVSGYGSAGCLTGNSYQSITVTFTVINSANPVVLAWGGHIANEFDWGEGNDAASISGAPYHMSQASCSFGCGSQDRALQTGSVAPPPTYSSQISHVTRTATQVVSDTMTLTDPAGKIAPTGSVNFYLCGPTGAITPCISGGTHIGGSATLIAISSSVSRASSASSSPLSNGVYCFRVEYINDGATNFSNGVYTSTPGECVTVTSATAVVLSKFTGRVNPDGTVAIHWTTASEVQTAGFNIYRSESPEGPYLRVNPRLVPASSNALTGSSYEFQDTSALPNRAYYFQLEEVELNGTSTRHDPVAIHAPQAAASNNWGLLALGVGLAAFFVIAGGLLVTLKKLNVL